jgi:hypothetical protein
MKEKILALLLAKFAGVRKDGLARLASSLALQAADETEATSIVEKLTAEKVNEYVTEWRKEVDKEVTEGVKTNERTLKDKYDFVEKKVEPKPAEPKPGDDIATIVANAVKAAVEPLQQEIGNLKAGKTTESRLQQLQAKLNLDGIPQSFKEQKLKDFGRMQFENDEAFTGYLTEVETSVTNLKQELSDLGMSNVKPPVIGAGGNTDEDAFINSMKAINEPQKEN